MKKCLRILIAVTLFFGCSSLASCSPSEMEGTEATEEVEEADESAPEPAQQQEPEAFTEEALIISSLEADVPTVPYIIERETREQDVPMGEEDTWTVFYYMCGADLESQHGLASGVLLDLMENPPSDNVNIVVQTGGSKSWGKAKHLEKSGKLTDEVEEDLEQSGVEDIDPTKLQRYELSDTLTLVDEQELASMGDPDTLYSFLSWGAENYPADKMAVVFYNHGGGSLMGVCFDELFENDGLSPADLDEAFSRLFPEMTDKFEYVQYSTCLSSSIEMATVLVPHARYMLASQEVSLDGDDSVITKTLNEHPEYSGAEFGKVYCENYMASFSEWEAPGSKSMSETLTFAVVDLGKLDAVLYALNDLSVAFNENRENEEYFNDVATALHRSESYLCAEMVDLGDFARQCKDFQPAEATNLENAVNDAVFFQTKGAGHAEASGLSFYYPKRLNNRTVTDFALCPTADEYKKFAAFVQKSYIEQRNTGYALVQSVDEPSVNSDNSLTLSVVAEDINKVIDVGYEVYAVQEGTDELCYLGYDTEVGYDEQTGSLHALFDGRWPTLNGEPLMISIISETEDDVIYKAPVMVNGERSNIVIRWIWQEEGEHTGYYEVVGVWSGIDDDEGFSTRDLREMKKGDKVIPLYGTVTFDELEENGTINRVQSAHGELMKELLLQEGSEVTIGETVEVSQQKLAEGDYYYVFTATDVLMRSNLFAPVEGHIASDGTLVWEG